MSTYKIQLKLHTLANCATKKDHSYDSFVFQDMHFTHWHFTWAEGHRKEYWLLSNVVTAENFEAANKIFTKKLNNIIPKIAFISQCYTEYIEESFLIHKTDSDLAYFRYVRNSKGVPLYFDNESLEALKQLTARQDISNEFFYYWNDMINSTGYSSKLLLACSALEALAKCIRGNNDKYAFLTSILGIDLKDKIFKPRDGIRHRLAHGEYFSPETDQENYLDNIYRKVIEYFNSHIFERALIEDVSSPQRNPYSNKEGWKGWLRKSDTNVQFDLKNLVDAWDKNGMSNFDQIEIASCDEEMANNY